MAENQTSNGTVSPSAGLALLTALSRTGFEICQFGPCDGDTCDICDRSNVQLYYRRTSYDCDEGEYYCADCVMQEHAQNQADLKMIEDKIKEGHTEHCACRFVWGDAECECGC